MNPVHRLLLLLVPIGCLLQASNPWNQWLGGPERSLVAAWSGGDAIPRFTLLWRRSLGSGFAGVAVVGTNAVTAMTDGRQDLAILLDTETGAERWRFALSRTRKRGEGVPSGPLSTPALDSEAAYVQALDGRFVCLEITTGRPRWELNVKREFKAYEPGYGFASSPLLLDDMVILLPAGSTSASAAALDRLTGAVRWRTGLGTGTDYVSATALSQGSNAIVIAQTGTTVAALAAHDGRIRWKLDDVAGGLWTPSILAGGSIFCPTAKESRLIQNVAETGRSTWTTPVFDGAMGPVVQLEGMLIGHHQRRLTAIDTETGTQLWQLPDETDGQLMVLGKWLLFVNDRAGQLEVLSVTRDRAEVRSRQPVMKPARMETPLAFADGRLWIRGPEELVVLKVE